MNWLDFVRQQGKKSGAMPVSALERLRDQLSSVTGELEYQVVGGYDLNRRSQPRLSIDIAGVLSLNCASCQNPLDWVVAIRSVVYLAYDEVDLARLDEEFGTEVIAGQDPFDVVSLLEEELLLSMPYFVTHEGGCHARAAPVEEKAKTSVAMGLNVGLTSNPFKILARLKAAGHEPPE